MRNVPFVDRVLDWSRGVGGYGMLVRLLLLVASAASMGSVQLAGGTSNPLLAVCAALLALATISRPDSHFGLGLIAFLALHWYAADVPALTASLLPALAILVVHVSAAHAAALPPRAVVSATVSLRWALHTGAAAMGTATVWMVTVLFSQTHATGAALATAAGVMLMLAVTVGLVLLSAPGDS